MTVTEVDRRSDTQESAEPDKNEEPTPGVVGMLQRTGSVAVPIAIGLYALLYLGIQEVYGSSPCPPAPSCEPSCRRRRGSSRPGTNCSAGCAATIWPSTAPPWKNTSWTPTAGAPRFSRCPYIRRIVLTDRRGALVR
ncbi:hypothetical protein [Nonomuraea harbinensis]|uniref:Uncharacterized protein n=1 Tax=Nonomuraea harbinensis TaxID=1286938 RepID=A0ABW1C321_9ACTN|nr:hypothetical protein [Nonomuraea harbinensis]